MTFHSGGSEGDFEITKQNASQKGRVRRLEQASQFWHPARNQGAVRAAGQRPTAPKGGRFVAASAPEQPFDGASP